MIGALPRLPQLRFRNERCGTANVAPQQTNVVQQVARNVNEVMHDVQADDLDVPTFLRRQAQKA